MNKHPDKALRGRPKTLDRAHIVDVAMKAYWKEGVGNVSINQICKSAKASKPGLYREFGGEDGLMKAVLIEYQQSVLTPMLQIVKEDKTFQESLETLVTFVTVVSGEIKAPKGCLLVKIRENHMRVGEATRKQIDLLQEQVLRSYQDWVERAKAKGEFSADMSSQFASTYIDAQISSALSQKARGEDSQVLKSILLVAFSMLK